MKIGTTNSAGEQQQISFGTHVDIVKFINFQEFIMNPSSTFNHDYAMDMLDSNGCWLIIKKPHEWSVSLAKALCLSDELF